MKFKDLSSNNVKNVAMAPDLNACGKFLGVTVSDIDPLILGSYKCPRGTKFSLYQDKLISSTKITGSNGTVKEMAGFDDWHISIEFSFFPIVSVKYLVLDELNDILSVWKKRESILVVNSFFLNLGIKSIVLTKIDLPNNDTDHDLAVRIDALSDEVSPRLVDYTGIF